MYNFLFDKKSLVLLVVGMIVAGGMLFFGGVLLGVQWGLPAESSTAFAPPSEPRPAALPASQPCPPAVAPATPTREEPAAPGIEPQPAPSPQESPEPQPVEQRAAIEPSPASVTEPARQDPSAAREPEARPAVFSLQVGAFREAGNSARVVHDLKVRGYEPYVVEQHGRMVLKTVRIGRYTDLDEATRAALDFRRREGMAAIVRPAGS
ncbi:MAG TPA: SPOR domain-containing protein [Thermoanaerobaculia bacterium]|nr:SPOR domain-containing protein [Thermoanaerobaculia bacterium]